MKKKLSLIEKDKNLIRDKERIRKKNYREQLKEDKLPQLIGQSQAVEPTVNLYKTSQSIGKAANSATQRLPYSPRKKAAFIKCLVKLTGFQKTTPKASGKAISS